MSGHISLTLKDDPLLVLLCSYPILVSRFPNSTSVPFVMVKVGVSIQPLFSNNPSQESQVRMSGKGERDPAGCASLMKRE